MDLNFRFDPEILIGADTLSMAGTVCKRYGQRIMVVADHSINNTISSRLKGILEDSGLNVIVFDVIDDDGANNAGIEIAENIAELSITSHCDAIIGFGGRKTQTITRMTAIMAPSRISAFELLDGLHTKAADTMQNKCLPLISIPTKGLDTFSFTDYFLVSDPRSRLIKSVTSPMNLYSAVIIDSTLHTFLSSVSGAAFIFDGFSSTVEAYCSSKSSFFSDPILERAISFYAKMFKGGANLNADTFVQASFLTALGTSASSPGAGSALAAAINVRFPVSKQQCSAVLLPFIAEKLITTKPEKMARVASFLGAGKAATVAETAANAVTVIRRVMEPMGLQNSLKDFNIDLDKVTASVEAARNLDFVANSPWIVSEEDVFNIIKKII